ncbi:MAG: hypothetical protein AAF311_01005 [Pseudomonadota bacterium]
MTVFKTILGTCAAFSIMFAASSAQANNTFNKFPTQSAATDTQIIRVSGFAEARNDRPTLRKPAYVKRVVRRATVTPAKSNGFDATVDKRFNKAHGRMAATELGMPVLFDRNVPQGR